jgi:uncharacterized membrane protein
VPLPLPLIAEAILLLFMHPQLGILSSSPPFLLSTFSSTPRGTNGGISPWGTLVSLLGGVFVGAVAVVALLAQGQRTACGDGWGWAVELVAVGAAAGFGGSMVRRVLSFFFRRFFVPLVIVVSE